MEEDRSDEETIQMPHKPIKKRVTEKWHIILKILEMALCIVCLGLIYEPMEVPNITRGHIHHLGVLYTSFAGYILINAILLMGYLFKEKIGYKTSSIFSLVGAGLNIVSSVLIFSDRDHFKSRIFAPHMYLLPLLMACSVCALGNAIIFTADAITTFKTKKDFGTEE